MSETIHLARPYFSDEESRLVTESIESGWIAQGPRVAEFERAVADYVGARHGIAVTSCTAGLTMCLAADCVGPGDEVILPCLTFIACANAIRHVGARPVFVDVSLEDYNLLADQVEAAITPATRAIMPIDQSGIPCDLEAILEIADRHDLHVVHDTACSLGSEYKGRRCGSLGPPSVFSFHPRKLITTGEGGLITTSDDELAKKLRILRQHGMDADTYDRDQAGKVMIESYPYVGYNFRMTDLQGAIGVAQMKQLPAILERRRALGRRYDRELEGLPGLALPRPPKTARTNYQTYLVRLEEAAPIDREELLARLLEDKIAGRRGVIHIPSEACYQDGYDPADTPNGRLAGRTTVCIPLHPHLSDDDQSRVIASIRRALR